MVQLNDFINQAKTFGFIIQLWAIRRQIFLKCRIFLDELERELLFCPQLIQWADQTVAMRCILLAWRAVDILAQLIHSLTLNSFSSFFFFLLDFSSIFFIRLSYLFYYFRFLVNFLSSMLLKRMVFSFFILSSLERVIRVLMSNYFLSFLLSLSSLLVMDRWTMVSNFEKSLVDEDLKWLWLNILPLYLSKQGFGLGYYTLFVFNFSSRVKKLLKSKAFTLLMGLDIIQSFSFLFQPLTSLSFSKKLLSLILSVKYFNLFLIYFTLWKDLPSRLFGYSLKMEDFFLWCSRRDQNLALSINQIKLFSWLGWGEGSYTGQCCHPSMKCYPFCIGLYNYQKYIKDQYKLFAWPNVGQYRHLIKYRYKMGIKLYYFSLYTILWAKQVWQSRVSKQSCVQQQVVLAGLALPIFNDTKVGFFLFPSSFSTTGAG